jgi:TIR domain
MLSDRERIVSVTDHEGKCLPVNLVTCDYFSVANQPPTPPDSWPARYGKWLAQQLAERRPIDLWRTPAGTWLAVQQGGECGVAINLDQLGDLQPQTTTTTQAPHTGTAGAATTLTRTIDSIALFYSYCHKDEKLREKLESHLAPMKHEGIIAGWHDRRIGAGHEWKGQIDEHLNEASVILLLVSPDFIASAYCRDVEMRRALERHDTGEALVIPIILRPTDWHEQAFAKLQALPKDGKPVTKWSNRDEAFLDVACGIRAAVNGLNHVGTPSSRIVQRETIQHDPVSPNGTQPKQNTTEETKLDRVPPTFEAADSGDGPQTVPTHATAPSGAVLGVEKSEAPPQPPFNTKVFYSLLIGLFFFVAFLAWQLPSIRMYEWGAGTYVVYLLASVLSALLMFGLLRSTGKFSGTKLGITFEYGGPAAFAVGVLGLGVYFEMALPRKPFEITIYLVKDDARTQVVAIDGKITLLTTPRRHEAFQKGIAEFRELPHGDSGTDVDYSIDVTGYELAPTAPVKLKLKPRDSLKLPLRPTQGTQGPPIDPDVFPDPTSISGLPSKAMVDEKPVIDDPARVYLEYRNATDRDLRLLVLDCSAYYAKQNDTFTRQPWLAWPFERAAIHQRFNGFRGGTGWYCFMVLEDGRRPIYVGSRNLYKTERNRLTVTNAGSEFFATFE